MDIAQSVLKLLMSIALGGMVGLEREFGKQSENKKYLVGIRTSMFICLLGYLSIFFGNFFEPMFSLAIGILCVLVVLSLAYLSRFNVYKALGLTTFVGGIITFLIGVLVGLSEYFFAVILTVLITAILAMRHELHFFVNHLTREEILSAVKMAIIAFVVFPILPNRAIDPWGLFNPYSFWYVVVLVSLLQFISFFLFRIVRKKRGHLPSLLGGFINSEMVAYNISQEVKKTGDSPNAFSNIILSNIAMILSCVVVSAIIFPSFEFFARFFMLLLVPVLLMFGSFTLNVSLKENSPLKVNNPFSVVSALKFSAIFFVVKSVAGSVRIYLSNFLGFASFFGGFFASTPIIASLSLMLFNGEIALNQAVVYMGLSLAGTILNKNFWVATSGNKKLMKKVFIHTLIHSVSLLAIVLLFV